MPLPLIVPMLATTGRPAGDTLFQVCSELGREGSAATRLDSSYLSGGRVTTWQKRKKEEGNRVHGPLRRRREHVHR